MTNSHQLFERAQKCIPGGVNSPVRAFRHVGGEPLFIQSGNGAYVQDVDGKNYIDYVGSWGPMILGHAHPHVLETVQTTIQNGLSFGAPTELEVELAELVCKLMPSIEMIRMVSSGTEATMSAIRLARGFTNRNKILKFAGCYHGHNDSLLVKAGSGILTQGLPDSAGVPEAIAQHTLVARYNDLSHVERLFQANPEDIAAIIVEPVAGNMNCIPPQNGFLEGLRNICNQYNSLLIFDEVMTGFRINLGGAQTHYQIKPDLTTLGKIIGGGMPVGAFGGRRDIMSHTAPLGPVYQAGTLSGNPVAMAAGIATLREVMKQGFYTKLEISTQLLMNGIVSRARAANIPLLAQSVGSMFGLFFTESTQIHNLDEVKQQCDVIRFNQFFHRMLDQGVYLAPSAFEAGFVSSAHGQPEIEKTLQAAEKVFATL